MKPIRSAGLTIVANVAIATGRAGLNEREAPGKIVTSRPPQRLAQLWSVSNALVSNLPKHRSKTSKLMRFGSQHFSSETIGDDHVRRFVCV